MVYTYPQWYVDTFSELSFGIVVYTTTIALSTQWSGGEKQKKMKASKKQTVKILGQTVTVGTKLHAKLVAQVKHFNYLSKYE